MSFGGMLAAALGGGTKAVYDQATGDIEDQRKKELAQAQFEIDKQRALFAEEVRRSGIKWGSEYETSPEVVDRKIAANDKTARAAGRTAAAVELDTLQNPELQGARRKKMADDATAEAQAKADATKALGGDKSYIRALQVLANAQSPDRTDYKGRELDNAIKQMTVDNARRVDTLRKEFATATPERKQQISDELSMLTGKDTDKFLPVPLKDEMGNITGYKVFDTKRGDWVPDAREKQETAIRQGIQKARADGKVADVVSELRAKGFKDEQLAQWLTPDELKGAKPKAEPKPAAPSILAPVAQAATGMFSAARAEGAAYEAIERRAREAGAGGAPLTAQEKAEARRFGIVVR